MNGFNNAFGTEAEEISLCALNSIVKRLVIVQNIYKYLSIMALNFGLLMILMKL